ncbi:MAG: Txe/YoeB family addiction module toxin [Rhodobacteraceae bacterium]|nr:MAG: Txe/YoeB family addiction module toxin [Paracoccaceae bacterium]
MNVAFSAEAWAQYQHWQTRDRKILKKINALIRECQRHPFAGTGKPEPLRGDLAGYWSRRISHEHRLVYKATETELVIVACRYHY